MEHISETNDRVSMINNDIPYQPLTTAQIMQKLAGMRIFRPLHEMSLPPPHSNQ
jgi:hypothetical protein